MCYSTADSRGIRRNLKMVKFRLPECNPTYKEWLTHVGPRVLENVIGWL